MESGLKKRKLADRVLAAANGLITWAEHRGLLARLPAFRTDYGDYPRLCALESAFPQIREECLRLVAERDRLTDMSALGGAYTEGGIHVIRWKSFMLKAGAFLPENCARCPATAAALRAIPDIYTAFFSILEPQQYIRPHWGYYRGFVRYHLPLIIPGDNRDKTCWIRVNANEVDNARRDKALIENGETYYWREGRGVFFDDTNLHDAANHSDSVRVVLFLDVRRRLPFWLDVPNRLLLAVATRLPQLKKIRASAKVGNLEADTGR